MDVCCIRCGENVFVPAPYRACLIDCLGTMVRLLPPWEQVGPEIADGVPPERLREAFAAEMAYYRDHADEGRDPETLAQLRARCAALLSDRLGVRVGVGAMMDAIVFEAYPDVVPALEAWRRRGLRIVCVSNWDYDLESVLDRLGLAPQLDAVVASAVVGSRKPDPEIFGAALRAAGCTAAEAFHVGDSDEDVAGATAAGIDVIRIDREVIGERSGDVSSLAEIVKRQNR